MISHECSYDGCVSLTGVNKTEKWLILSQALGAFSKVEAVILETLAGIPEMMDDAKRYIEIYDRFRDQVLEKKTFELYLSILKALNHIMQFFVDSSWSESEHFCNYPTSVNDC